MERLSTMSSVVDCSLVGFFEAIELSPHDVGLGGRRPPSFERHLIFQVDRKDLLGDNGCPSRKAVGLAVTITTGNAQDVVKSIADIAFMLSALKRCRGRLAIQA